MRIEADEISNSPDKYIETALKLLVESIKLARPTSGIKKIKIHQKTPDLIFTA